MSEDAMQPNSNGFSTKEVLVRLEGKLDQFMVAQADVNAKIGKSLDDLRLELLKHEMEPGHNGAMDAARELSERVETLEDDELKRDSRAQGRNDVLKYIFGTSLAAFVLGVLSFVGMVYDLLSRS